MSSVPSVSQAAAGGPVELERASGVRNGSSVESQGLGGGGRGREIDETVAGIASTTNIRSSSIEKTASIYLPRELVADHLDVDLLAHLEPEIADEVFVDPRLKLTHPDKNVSMNTNRIANRGCVEYATPQRYE